MKAIRLLALTILLAATPAALSAQENLKKAFDDFIGDKDLVEYIRTSSFSENKGNGNKPTSFYYEYDFTMPIAKRKSLNPVIAAFRKDMGAGYNVYTKDANLNSNTLVNIAYGNDLQKRVSFGTHIERNYMVMLVRDTQDSLKRYVYAIVWYVNNGDDTFRGSLHKIYGFDPQKMENTTKISNKLVQLNNDGSIYISDPSTGKSTMLSTNMGADKGINNGLDFLGRFGTLRATFLNPDLTANNTVRTVLANKIVELCHDYGNLLSANERGICIKGITEMQKECDDKYISGLFDIAISKLKK